MKFAKRALVTVALLVLALCPLLAADQNPTLSKEQPTLVNGTVVGILANKGENWIAVKAEGTREAARYSPIWRGGLPSEGGGLDKETLAAIKKLVLTTLVSVTWEMQDNQRRIVSMKSLPFDGKTGTVSGTVLAKGENWIDVKPKDGLTERYMAKWIAGPPNAEGKPQGGGLDKDLLKAIAALKIGSTVEVKWFADERKRLDTLTVISEPATPTPEHREGEREHPK